MSPDSRLLEVRHVWDDGLLLIITSEGLFSAFLSGARCTHLFCATNPAGAASLTLGKQQCGPLKDGPGGSPVLPARQNG